MAKLRQFWQDFKLLATQRFEPRISGLVAGEAGAALSQQEATAWRPPSAQQILDFAARCGNFKLVASDS